MLIGLVSDFLRLAWEGKALVDREEGDIFLLEEVLHIEFHAIALCLFLLVDHQDIVQVRKHVMLLLDVVLERFALDFELKLADSADEAFVDDVIFNLLPVVPHVPKGINNYSKHQVQQEHYDYDEEGKVKEDSELIVHVFLWELGEHFSDPTSCSDTLVRESDEAVIEGLAEDVSFLVKGREGEAVIGVSLEEAESKEGVDVDDDEHEEACVHQLHLVLDDDIDHALQQRDLQD